ncbi:hypothetical protein L195_g003881 [Trifolium pratense]|uniref:Uncharacterized protein n=1 Tax=Trifolium pratense TaxID=57577 RepID=A0A2K3NWI0_TRIPR|nr:hypothetical protein L195_g003881 [Trifolium pratense]
MCHMVQLREFESHLAYLRLECEKKWKTMKDLQETAIEEFNLDFTCVLEQLKVVYLGIDLGGLGLCMNITW